MTKAAGVRTVHVRSPSVAREAAMVGIAAFQIVFWSGVVIAATTPSSDDPAASLQADEIAFAKLDPEEQRMFRRALDGLAEAEDMRSTSGAWPSIGQLAARGIPPFATDPIDKAGYRWQLVRDRLIVNYVGIPDAADRPTLVIAAIEPERGMSEMVPVDETHHKLADGTVIHVGVYHGTARTYSTPLAQFPFLDGWRRIAAYR